MEKCRIYLNKEETTKEKLFKLSKKISKHDARKQKMVYFYAYNMK